MQEKILVTGVNGFVGHHVAEQLHDSGISVLGVDRRPELQDDLKGIVGEYVSCDLTDPEAIKSINLEAVSAIINLAGFAKVGESRGQGELYDKVNIGVHTVLYDECLRQNASPRIVAVSTGAVYDPNQPLPQTEESKLHDVNAAIEYIASKIKMEQAVAEYRKKGLDVIITRPLNHTGPGQLPGFLVPDIGAQIEEAIEQDKPLLTGNLDTRRDYTDVRDVARAYVLLATTDRSNLHHDLYNICSGESVLTKDIVKKLAAEFGAPDIRMEIDPDRVRANDIMDIYGSSKKLREDTGWEPTISVDQMIHDYAQWKKAN
jgi:GDP-4-dehydro-6-deoxy-D-mannose reductase